MRAQRQKIKLLKQAGADENDIISARCKYCALSAEYTDFCDKMNLPQERQRVYSDGLGNIGTGKTKPVANSENSGIINTGSDNVLINKSSSASPLYISEKDELYNNAKQVEPIDGYEDIVIHADKHNFYSYNMQGDEFSFTAEEMAKMLKQSKGYHGGNIRLIACESAAEGATTAQELSNILGVEILAPSDIVWVDPNGNMTIGPTGEMNTGHWVKIKPKKE